MSPLLPIVYVSSIPSKPGDVIRQLEEASQLIGLSEDARKAKVVLIKPNLTYPHYKQGVTTRAEFVEGIVDHLVNVNKRIKIFIGEGEGGYNSFSMTQAMKIMGFNDIASRYPQVEIINLSSLPARSVEMQTGSGPYHLALPDIFFTDIDFSISVPLPKIHCMTTLTLSLKNLWGCLPDVMRLKNHYMFSELIFRVAQLLKFRYAFLDGKYGLDSNGPMDGDVVEVNWFAAANNLGAFDSIVAEMMGFDWQEIPHLRKAGQNGFIPDRSNIVVHGNIGTIKRQFVLRRTLWNYPALAAFRSRALTRLFYFSKLSGPMHDLMYTFRKRSILE